MKFGNFVIEWSGELMFNDTDREDLSLTQLKSKVFQTL